MERAGLIRCPGDVNRVKLVQHDLKRLSRRSKPVYPDDRLDGMSARAPCPDLRDCASDAAQARKGRDNAARGVLVFGERLLQQGEKSLDPRRGLCGLENCESHVVANLMEVLSIRAI